MSEPDYSHSDYESDEYYDEQGRKVQEFDYSSETVPLAPRREWPAWPQDVLDPTSTGGQDVPDRKTVQDAVDDPNSGITELEQVEPEEPSDNLPLLGESASKSKVEVKKDFTPRSGYTWDEMIPTVRDPLCKSTTELACFWPVYVGNFRCENRQDEFNCVKEYFAWKGLHVRWWFRLIDDEYYEKFQSKVGIFDMLVYFVSERDANQAIQQCHRDTYKGYPLNVFPGRVPVYFDPMLSLQALKMNSGKMFSELFFEQHVKDRCWREVNVTCTVKFALKHGAMEFATVADKTEALQRIKFFKFEAIPEKLQKQRFLEHNHLKVIEEYLMLNRAVLQANRDDKYVKLLLANKRPQVDPNPKQEPKPLRGGPPKHVQQKKFQRKMEKFQKEIGKAVAAGREPKCYDKRHKKQFNQMVENAKQNL